jgi:hypothetical protein
MYRFASRGEIGEPCGMPPGIYVPSVAWILGGVLAALLIFQVLV